MSNMDALFDAVAQRGHVCLGLDTALEYLPPSVQGNAPSPAEAILAFNRAIIDATIDLAACFKVQIAYYEALGLAGLQTYALTLAYLRERGALVIADIKRSDIADTARAYARAHFQGDFEADFVTLNPYLGMDTLEPWLEHADQRGKGAFVLMRTSNPGRSDLQLQELKGGSPPLAADPLRDPKKRGEPAVRSVSSATSPPGGEAPKPPPPGQQLCDLVGSLLAQLAEGRTGRSGYASFGAVVGVDAQSPAERDAAMEIRTRYPQLFFLIPGYGAQGGAASDAALLLRQGNGGVVNASRSILRAWQSQAPSLQSQTPASQSQAPASQSQAPASQSSPAETPAGASPAGPGSAKADLIFAAQAARQAVITMRDAIRAAAEG